jgi:integrase
MTEATALQSNVVPFSQTKKAKPRKIGVNKNRKGSVRSINGQLYVDFMHLGERVREKTGLNDNRDNMKTVRQMLDRIMMAIESGTFKFAEVFPSSKKKDYFKGKEAELAGNKKTPDQLLFKDYAWVWYNLLKGSGRVSQRTLFGYKIYLNSYLIPFFGNLTFDDLSASTFEKFIVWARKRKLKGRQIGNRSTNKIFVPLKMICNSAMNEYRWPGYNPFFGFRKLPEDDAYEKIKPFNLEEQKAIIDKLPEHWKPYFLCAFCIGLRQGEEIGLKSDDIDWENGLLHIRRGITTNEDGEIMEGPTKNKYSRRTIKLNSIMIKALSAQKVIHDRFRGEYFFCSHEGQMVHRPNLYRRVWLPALKEASIPIRDMKQTRHSFATVALSRGENPLWIAKVMGHRDTSMIIRVYSKYVENICGTNDGSMLDAAYQELAIGN